MSDKPQSFVNRYLDGQLREFYQLAPGDIPSALQQKLDRPRQKLVAALRGEVKRLGAPAEVGLALDKLENPRSKVVVTGQQPGLLFGPAYTLSKALSALSLARELDSEECPVVAVFWVASQDHDTAEIDHTYLLDCDERLHRLHVSLPEGVPGGEVPFREEWLGELSAALTDAASRSEYLKDVQHLLVNAAAGATSYADYFTSLLYRLLGTQGLIVLDPTRSELAPLLTGVLEAELEAPLHSGEAIRVAGDSLRKVGFEPQLGRAEGATNLFINEVEAGLPRRRLLRFNAGVFHSDTARYSLADLRTIVAQEPARITPAAGLRPVVQDATLPTAAFVVGPGELRYLAQLRGVYEFHSVTMPLVWPRSTVTVLEPPVRRIFDRYGLDYQTYASERAAAAQRVVLTRHGHAQLFDRALARLERECELLLEHVEGIDPTLIGSVERSEKRIERAIELLREKSARALLREDEITARQFGRLEAQLYPGGTPQERRLSPFSFMLKFGIGPMLELYRSVGSSGDYLLRP